MEPQSTHPIHGRGSQHQPTNRFLTLESVPDEAAIWADPELRAERQRPSTQYHADLSQTIVSTNESPDVPFRYSLNPYRGCAHGCSYCYARPTHEYLGLSAGLDFETQIFAKHDAARLFRDWLARPAWVPEWIALSGVTDAYQPVEREYQITRQCLQVAVACRQPIGIVTKNGLVTRDLDLLGELASYRAAQVAISLTTLDAGLARTMEPRTSTPVARLKALDQIAAAGIPAHVMVAPVIPGLNDAEIPPLLKAARDAGATSASYVMLRLPTPVDEVFLRWLDQFFPDRRGRIETLIRSVREGALYQSEFKQRMRGCGAVAQQIHRTFELFHKRYGYRESEPLKAHHFVPPMPRSGQRWLF